MSSSPSTPTRKQRKYNFATPTAHQYTTPTSDNMFDDDDIDQDTSPYSRSYSQIAGAEVTWGKRKTPVSSKSKPYVQNRRIYTCVADGTCEITKAQRNICQYCRFKKCIEQGMVLQAVREDRMPGGRNSGAVYNLYKVKYKKHKKSTQKSPQQKLVQSNESTNQKSILLSLHPMSSSRSYTCKGRAHPERIRCFTETKSSA